jgi:hypothetical protein
VTRLRAALKSIALCGSQNSSPVSAVVVGCAAERHPQLVIGNHTSISISVPCLRSRTLQNKPRAQDLRQDEADLPVQVLSLKPATAFATIADSAAIADCDMHSTELAQAASEASAQPAVRYSLTAHPKFAFVALASSKCEPQLVQYEKPNINPDTALQQSTRQDADAPPCLNPEDLLRSSDGSLGVAESAAVNTDAGASTFAARACRVLQLPRMEEGRLIGPPLVPVACTRPGCEGQDCAGSIHPHHHGPEFGAHCGGAASLPAWELLETCDPVENGDDLLASASCVWGHSTLLGGCSCEQRLAQ